MINKPNTNEYKESLIYQGQITKELIKECVGKANPLILEIGANDGTNTLWFLDIFSQPQIHCFEPEPRAIDRFHSIVGKQPNVKLWKIALSDRNGEITFYRSDGQWDDESTPIMPDGWDLSGSIRQPKEHLQEYPWVKFEQSLTVPTSTLDSWYQNQKMTPATIDFIWMDVQGAEIDVFRGGRNTIARTRFIYTEYSNQELYQGQYNLSQLLEYLQDFEILVQYADDVLLINKNFPFSLTDKLQKLIQTSRNVLNPQLNIPVYRFQNSNFPGTYTYVKKEEADNIRQHKPHFIEEGIAFHAAMEQNDLLVPIYRFQNLKYPESYLYVQSGERAIILNDPELVNLYIEKDIAFYAHPSNSGHGKPIYRFQNTNFIGVYIYVTAEEADQIRTNFPQFVDEGIVFEAILRI